MDITEIERLASGTHIEGLGIGWEYAGSGEARAFMEVNDRLLAPNGYLHAAAVVGIADSTCGVGCMANLPDGAISFTTVELKSNFVGTTTTGRVVCVGKMAHGGRTTQVWDAVVSREDGRQIALFRCTQILLYST